MKTLALVLAFFAFTQNYPSPASAKDVGVSTDKFTGVTTVSLYSFQIGPEHGFKDATHLNGHVILALSVGAAEDKIGLRVISQADHWQFLDGAAVHVLTDGRRLDLGHFERMKAHTETYRGITTYEEIFSFVDRSLIDTFAAAKTIEIKIGPYEAVLSAQDIERFRLFLDALQKVRPVQK
jgi:hypothetical protein